MSSKSLPKADLEHVLEHTLPLWDEMRGARLFLTGGTGFFGMWLLETLLYANQELNLKIQATILTRDQSAFEAKAPLLAHEPAFSFLEGDVRTFKFPSGEVSHVIHAATQASAALNAAAPLEMFEVAALGTKRALEMALHCKAKRFLLTSSGGVYGTQPTDLEKMDEDFSGTPDLRSPASAYGLGKRAAEWMSVVCGQNSEMEVSIARGFAFVGPHLPLDAHFAMGNFLRDGLNGSPICIAGDGTPLRSYLYGADLAVWLWTILLKGAPGRAYNVGSDQAVSIEETARAVAASVVPPPRVRIAHKATTNEPSARYIPSIQRAKEELGLDVKIGLQDAIARTIKWHRSAAK